jgi:hypothetical protein
VGSTMDDMRSSRCDASRGSNGASA